ncbi:peptidase inhibitor family I36 protein [Streptomyces collinus]|uniref:peptidase inhibitor family I36 protein n=1 Tax=Streptomyces collinus TaxID=42684 RepID=UPI003698DAAE
MNRKLLSIAAVSLSMFGLNAISTGAAHAQVPSTCTVGVNCPPYSCETGEACLYYNSIENGLNGIYKQHGNIADYRYDSTGHPIAFQISNYGGEGSGQTVKNNAGAVWNRSDQRFGVFYNSSYSCAVACQSIPSLVRVDLNSSLKNNNASGYYY